ncbi:MAG TPA: hypothetical protein DCP94_09255, partial [Massilia timonae]|nr:hypothetical protein [Massilia timonae]
LADALAALEQATDAVPTDARQVANALVVANNALDAALEALRSVAATPAPIAPGSTVDLARARRAAG